MKTNTVFHFRSQVQVADAEELLSSTEMETELSGTTGQCVCHTHTMGRARGSYNMSGQGDPRNITMCLGREKCLY